MSRLAAASDMHDAQSFTRSACRPHHRFFVTLDPGYARNKEVISHICCPWQHKVQAIRSCICTYEVGPTKIRAKVRRHVMI